MHQDGSWKVRHLSIQKSLLNWADMERKHTVPQGLSIELLQQSEQMSNGLTTSAIVTTTQSIFPSIPTSEHSVVFNCACDARESVLVHMAESLTVLQTSVMGDVIL